MTQPLLVRVDLGVMVIKGYSTLPTAQEMRPRTQHTHFEGVLPPGKDYSEYCLERKEKEWGKRERERQRQRQTNRREKEWGERERERNKEREKQTDRKGGRLQPGRKVA